ncbi:MAG: nitrate/nitrite transporter NrtS [Planctomycetaceae bacterium]
MVKQTQQPRRPDRPTGREQPPASLLAVALRWCVVKRALILAVIVGSILIAINHYRCMLHGGCDSGCMIQCALTLVVPYCVSTISSVLAYRDQCRS